MNSMHFVGLDVHKKTIAFCVKTQRGETLSEGDIPARRSDLDRWMKELPKPWAAALEATLFTGWIYDHLLPHADSIQVAHPLMLKAIAASKKKNDRLDAQKICDLLRCDLLPECYMAPQSIRDLRRILRYRNLVVANSTRMKNKISGLLMEVGSEHAKSRLHGKRYFAELLRDLGEEIPDSVKGLLRMSRAQLEMFQSMQRQILRKLMEDRELLSRVELLRSIPGVGQITALTWALEIGDPHRFRSISRAQSYCGLTSGQHASAGKDYRGPISKQRNKHLQTILIEAAKLAPRFNPQLAQVRERELQRGNANRATLAVARKLVAYLMCVDKSGEPFTLMQTQEPEDTSAA